MQRLRIATRRSPLALVQANFVADRLRMNVPSLDVELVEIATRGDIDQSASLVDSVGQTGKPGQPGKGVFIDSLRDALADGRADLATHSMKDVPVAVPEGHSLSTFGPRADARDALVVPPGLPTRTLVDLPAGARVATFSIRRHAFLKHLRRDLEITPIRGNVGTRLRRLDEGDCDALLLACAGLDRLDLGARISQRIDVDVLVPPPGQGALAVEFLADRSDVADLVAPAVDPNVERTVTSERELARHIGADCAMPLGAHCVADGPTLRLVALAADADATRVLRVALSGTDPLALGSQAGARLEALGARSLLGS